MKRRKFLTLVGGTTVATWLLRCNEKVAAQQGTTRVLGYLSGGAPIPFAPFLAACKEGLREVGYVEGQNLTIEYRWAEGRSEQLPQLASELVGRKVDVIIASGGDLAARAAKAATTTIPIACTIGDDPVAAGLVASLSRPGGNLTGVSFLFVELHPKRLELITELVPQARIIALLVNPKSPQTERVIKAMQEALFARHLQLHIERAGVETEIDAGFASIGQLKDAALVVQADPLYVARREQLAALAARHALPAIYEGRQFAVAGGLVSYGASVTSVYHQVGVYAGRMLKGEKPGDLPVQQPTKFELVVNVKVAKAIGLNIPQSFLARADEVIE